MTDKGKNNKNKQNSDTTRSENNNNKNKNDNNGGYHVRTGSGDQPDSDKTMFQDNCPEILGVTIDLTSGSEVFKMNKKD